MTNVVSPVTMAQDTVLIEKIDSGLVIEKYKNEIKIDVARFFKDKEEIKMYLCKQTGYRFFYPPGCIGDDKFYKELSESRPTYYSLRWEHKKAFDYIKETDKVIEIGSGYGVFLEQLKSKGINGAGLEINPDAVFVCQKKDINLKKHLIEDEVEISKGSYSIVCCFQVLEHITEVNSFINAACDLLESNGKFIVGVPNNNPYLFKYDKYHTLNLPPHHAGLWDKKSLKQLEKYFPLKLDYINFEPLNFSYVAFLNVQLNHNPNFFLRITYKVLYKFFPNYLRKFLCYFYKGRNILAVYSKTK